jgi:hypothetical protein
MSSKNKLVTDILGRELNKDDFVVFHTNVYQIIEPPIPNSWDKSGGGQIKILLLNKSKTTRAVNKYSKDACLLNKDDVVFWILKRKLA